MPVAIPIAIAAGSAISGVAGAWGAAKQADAARDAASTQSAASRYATDISNQQYQQNRQDMLPYMQAGTQALGQLSSLSRNFTPTTVGGLDPSGAYSKYTGQFTFNQDDPSYQWRLNQGLDALNASAAAKGGYFSGATGRALMDYGQGAASQEYQNAFARDLSSKQFGLGAYNTAYGQIADDKNTYWNQLASLSNAGLGSLQQVGNWGAQNAQNAGQNALNSATAQGNAMQSGAGAWSGAAQNMANQLQGGIGNYLQYQMLNKALGGVWN